MLCNGSAFAIKRLNTCKLEEKQFHLEMNRIGQLRHPKLAPFAVLCGRGGEAFGVLSICVMGLCTLCCVEVVLNWIGQLDIARLHHGCHPPIIHQNICSNVILFDEDLDGRIMDFRLASVMTFYDVSNSRFVDGNLEELGYATPECLNTKADSLRRDAIGIGLTLKLLTGQIPHEVSNFEDGLKSNLVDWLNRLSTSSRIKDAIDNSV